MALAMTASTALAQTGSQFCDQIVIDGKTYPATSITQKDDATVLSMGNIVTAIIPVVHPQDKKAISFTDEKGLYLVKGTLTNDIWLKAIELEQLTIYGSMDDKDKEIIKTYTAFNTSVNFVDIDGKDITDLSYIYRYATDKVESITFANCDFCNVTTIEAAFNDSNVKKVSLKGMGLTNKVTNIKNLFYDCSKLESIDFSGCDFSNVTSYRRLFKNCDNLKEIKAIGCNKATIELLRKAIENNGQMSQVTLITE